MAAKAVNAISGSCRRYSRRPVQGYIRSVHQYPDQASFDGIHRICGAGCELSYLLNEETERKYGK